MKFQSILFDIDDSIATITLNRPEIHNAFDDQMIAELIVAIQSVSDNKDLRILLLKAKGKSFSAGADLAWMQRMVAYSYEQNLQDAKQLASLMHLLYSLNKPTIAVIQGAAFGGGVGLISCCDIAVATENAVFCLSETRLGLIPAVISPYVINALGERTARRYYLTAERFDATEALRLGLIHTLTTAEQLETVTADLRHHLLKNSPAALTAAKHLINATSRGHIDMPMIEDTAHRIATIRTSAEGQEGLKAFLEKRSPIWSK